MTDHVSVTRMHELLDGTIPSEAAERIRDHLAVCAECREQCARLSDVVSDLRALPRDAAPPEELWAGIRERIDGTVPADAPASADVLQLPGSRPGRRVYTFTGVRLGAASLALSLLSAGAVWMVLSRTPGAPGGSAAEILPVAGSVADRFATDESVYNASLEELLTIVDAARPYLAPETLVALDESLATIDAAIEEIRVALVSDPSSELLNGMLVTQQRSKLRVLRQVATRVQAQS